MKINIIEYKANTYIFINGQEFGYTCSWVKALLKTLFKLIYRAIKNKLGHHKEQNNEQKKHRKIS